MTTQSNTEPKLEPIYVASRASIAERGMMWRQFRAEGIPITSSWIDEDGEGQTASFVELWDRIYKEIAAASALVLYAERDDFPLKGALIEAGIALGMGKPVIVCLPDLGELPRNYRPVGSWIAHPLVSRRDDIRKAVELATRARVSANSTEPVEKARYEKAHEARYTLTHAVHPDIVVLWFLALKSHWFDDSKNMFYGQREQAKAYLYKWVETGELADDHTTLEIAIAMKFREWLSSSWAASPEVQASPGDEHYNESVTKWLDHCRKTGYIKPDMKERECLICGHDYFLEGFGCCRKVMLDGLLCGCKCKFPAASPDRQIAARGSIDPSAVTRAAEEITIELHKLGIDLPYTLRSPALTKLIAQHFGSFPSPDEVQASPDVDAEIESVAEATAEIKRLTAWQDLCFELLSEIRQWVAPGSITDTDAPRVLRAMLEERARLRAAAPVQASDPAEGDDYARGFSDMREQAMQIAEGYCQDIPEKVDIEANGNEFAAGYLVAAGGIRQALSRVAAPVEQSSTVVEPSDET